jgi:membrane protein
MAVMLWHMAGIYKNPRELYMDKVWRLETRSLSPLHRNVVVTVRLAHNIMQELAEGNLTLRAMSLLYTTLV